VISVISPAGPTDLIAQEQERLYSFKRSIRLPGAAQGVFAGLSAEINLGNNPAVQLADFVTLSTLSGFEFTHSDEGPGGEISDPDGDGASDQMPVAQANPGFGERRPPDSYDEGFVASEADVPSGLQMAADSVSNDVLPAPDNGRVPRNTQHGEMLLAAWVGVPAWYSRQQRPKTGSFATTSDAAAQRFGRWTRAAGQSRNEERLLLDRRAGVRADPARQLAAGAIERTAKEWLDDRFSQYPNVHDMSCRDKMPEKAVIDWGSGA
jgi:hypothetical protein